jgi:hypothetical protein
MPRKQKGERKRWSGAGLQVPRKKVRARRLESHSPRLQAHIRLSERLKPEPFRTRKEGAASGTLRGEGWGKVEVSMSVMSETPTLRSYVSS